jgi:hypothetical protein
MIKNRIFKIKPFIPFFQPNEEYKSEFTSVLFINPKVGLFFIKDLIEENKNKNKIDNRITAIPNNDIKITEVEVGISQIILNKEINFDELGKSFIKQEQQQESPAEQISNKNDTSECNLNLNQ